MTSCNSVLITSCSLFEYFKTRNNSVTKGLPCDVANQQICPIQGYHKDAWFESNVNTKKHGIRSDILATMSKSVAKHLEALL